MIRLFIALDLSNETKQKLFAHMLALKNLRLNGSWVKKENLHITLKFLGDTDDYVIPRIDELLTSIANETGFINSSIGAIGAFPFLRNPRVVFFNVEDNGAIGELFRKIDGYSAHWGGAPEERPFASHITFLRLKERYNLAAPSIEPLLSFNPIKVTFKEVILYKSRLTSQGSVYEPLHRATFHMI